MKLKYALYEIVEDVDQDAMSTANALLLVDKLKSNAELMGALSQLKLPSDKYKAIMKFSELIGIPENRFGDFINNINVLIQKQKSQK